MEVIAMVCSMCGLMAQPDTPMGRHIGWFGVCAVHEDETMAQFTVAEFNVHLSCSQQVEQVKG